MGTIAAICCRTFFLQVSQWWLKHGFVWVHWIWIWEVHMYVQFGKKSLTPVASATAVTNSAEKI
jgi:hypothetical protein